MSAGRESRKGDVDPERSTKRPAQVSGLGKASRLGKGAGGGIRKNRDHSWRLIERGGRRSSVKALMIEWKGNPFNRTKNKKTKEKKKKTKKKEKKKSAKRLRGADRECSHVFIGHAVSAGAKSGGKGAQKGQGKEGYGQGSQKSFRERGSSFEGEKGPQNRSQIEEKISRFEGKEDFLQKGPTDRIAIRGKTNLRLRSNPLFLFPSGGGEKGRKRGTSRSVQYVTKKVFYSTYLSKGSQ